MDPAPNPYGNIVEVRKLPIKEYVVREHSFTKRELLPEQLQKGPDGKPWPWKWGKERLLNEAYALNLVKEYTTIPVPRLYLGGDYAIRGCCGFRADLQLTYRKLKLPSSPIVVSVCPSQLLPLSTYYLYCAISPLRVFSVNSSSS
jgi:hypothetical protein